MTFIINNWLLIAVALASGAGLLWPLLRGGATQGLASADAVLLINREKAVVLDVSEPEEFAQGHIVGARNLPFGQVEEKLSSVVKNKGLPLILVCPRGARAGRLMGSVKKLGYEQAHVLAGGLDAWKAANLPVVKS